MLRCVIGETCANYSDWVDENALEFTIAVQGMCRRSLHRLINYYVGL